MTLTKRTEFAALLTGLVLTVPMLLGMGDIQVVNGGFEDPPYGDDDYDFVHPGWDAYDPDETGSGFGIWNPPVANYPKIPEGLNVGWVEAFEIDTPVGLSQTLTATLQPATTYVLTVGVGDAFPAGYEGLEGFGGYRVELLAGDKVLAADDNTLTIQEGTFATSTVTYTTCFDDPEIGMSITIRLLNLNLEAAVREIDFDNVELIRFPACPADLDADSVVGTGDLVVLLGGWGSPNGDVNCDGTTDTADLIELLGSWGECEPPPPPTGACCLVDSCVEVSADECAALGGEYQGDPTFCNDGVCQTEDGWLVEVPFLFNGDTCTEKSPCGISNAGEGRFVVTVPNADTYTFSVCGAVWDTIMRLGSTPCDDDLGFNDDGPGCNLASEIVVTLKPGTYYLTLTGFNDAICGEFTLTGN